MSRRPSFVRALLASAALAAAFALAGCVTDGVSIPDKALKELSPEMLSLLEQKHMPKESPMLVRIFKEEAELEVWKQDDTGRFAPLRTYAICRWSGELGPKVKEGDRQAPEGFYTITPGQMNPNSNYYLSFNLGYPNAYDRAYDRTGAQLMVHGDCSSRGCYAMTDEQIGEIYSVARESFFGGQRSFQVQAYPFRMTALNMAKHRNSPHMAFWRNLKEGYDHFEVSRQEPKVSVCEKRYVFDAAAPANAPPLKFDPRGKCPAYEIPQELANAVKDKQVQEDREFAELVKNNTPTVAVRTGTDGGTNPIFLAKFKPREIGDADGRMRMASTPAAPTTTSNSGPARQADATNSVPALDTRKTSLAAAEDPSLSERLFGGWFKTASASDSKPTPQPTRREPDSSGPRTVGKLLRGSDTSESQKQAAMAAKSKSAPSPSGAVNTATTASILAPAATRPPVPQAHKAESQQKVAEAADGQGKPAASAAANSASGEPLMTGAQPMLQSSSFDSRWSGVR